MGEFQQIISARGLLDSPTVPGANARRIRLSFALKAVAVLDICTQFLGELQFAVITGSGRKQYVVGAPAECEYGNSSGVGGSLRMQRLSFNLITLGDEGGTVGWPSGVRLPEIRLVTTGQIHKPNQRAPPLISLVSRTMAAQNFKISFIP